MTEPRRGHNRPEDVPKEAQALEKNIVNGTNGKAWDAFWKILSLMVLPWATAVTVLVWNLTVSVTAMKEDVKHSHEEFDRRLQAIEIQMDPTKRFYRWDGIALENRIEDLERLHPRIAKP